MSRRRQGRPAGADDRPYVAIEVYCKAHPTRRLAWFGRCTYPGAQEALMVALAGRGQSEIRPDGETKVHIRCGTGCPVDLQWRMEKIAGWLAAVYAPGLSKVWRFDV